MVHYDSMSLIQVKSGSIDTYTIIKPGPLHDLSDDLGRSVWDKTPFKGGMYGFLSNACTYLVTINVLIKF